MAEDQARETVLAALRDQMEAAGCEVRETHISLVFLGADEVWKVKKPVALDFLDFSDREARRRACEDEVRLNRRLAPDVYLGVTPVVRREDGSFRFTGDGEVVDWTVHMLRLPDEERADVRLEAGRLGTVEVARLAERISDFHRAARSEDEIARLGRVEVLSRNVEENFEQTRDVIRSYLSAEQEKEAKEWQRNFLGERDDLFTHRVETGRVRDGHGDLRLEHVYFRDGGISVIDCIEFNDRFRYGDVCADIAFLAMDLGWHGRVDLAESFVARYAELSDDFDLYPLLDFYESYRAFVRGKISSFAARNRELRREERERAGAEAQRYFLQSLASQRRALVPPRLIAVGGTLASGKSTIAVALGEALHLPVVGSDRTRKSLADVEATEPLEDAAFSGHYTPSFTRQVYDEVLRRAEQVLASERGVILDASFRESRFRFLARELARRHNVPFHFVECRAPDDVVLERLEHRESEQGVSDGRLEILDSFVDRWEPVDELPAGEHLVVDTTKPEEEVRQRILALLGGDEVEPGMSSVPGER